MSAASDTQQDRSTTLDNIDHVVGFIDAAMAVVRLFDGDTGYDLAGHMNFSEIEPIAQLAMAAGRNDLAQQIVLYWAEQEEDAEDQVDDLEAWGIGLAVDDQTSLIVGGKWAIVTEEVR